MNVRYTSLLSLFLVLPLRLHADERSNNLDLSSFSLAGLRVLPIEKRVKALNFWLETLSGREEVTLSKYRNKVLVINFWATWCSSCRADMPAIEFLHRELNSQGLTWLAVNSGEDHRTVDGYIERYNYTFTVLLDPKNSNVLRYGIENLPATLVVNKNGYIVALAVGSIDWRNRDVIEAFQKLLAE